MEQVTAEQTRRRVEFRLTPEDLFRFWRAYEDFHWRIVVVILGVAGGLFEPIRDIVTGRATDREWSTLGIVLLSVLPLIGAMVPLRWLYLRWLAGRIYRDRWQPMGDCALEISPEGLFSSDQLGESRSRWSAITRIRDTQHAIYLHQRGPMVTILPRHAFRSPEEAEAFLRAARAWHAATDRAVR
jgi:hypothetical protein